MLGALASWLFVLAPAAEAAVPPQWAAFPQISGGSGTGEISYPAAIATDPGNGHVYVVERDNARISEFTAWGVFVKTWGWGVVASGPGNDPRNEIQEVAVEATVTGGAFKLKQRELGATTAEIAYDAPASAVQEALEALVAIGAGNVQVSGATGGPWTVEYVSALADQDISPLEIVGSTLIGGAASTKTTQTGGNFEVCEPALGDTCRKGQQVGVEPGEIREPGGLAVDPVSGDLYLYEGNEQFLGSYRVQRFDPETGEFLAMIGGEVNKTTTANVCTEADIEGGDVCGAGVPGTSDAHFDQLFVVGRGGGNLTVDSAGNLYVGDKNRVQKFDSSGSYLKSLPVPEAGNVRALTYDEFSDSLYFAYLHLPSDTKPDIYKIDPESGAVLSLIPLEFPLALSTDPEGNLYVVAEDGNALPVPATEVIEFDAAGKPVIGLGEGFDRHGQIFSNPRPGVAINTGCETLGIYVLNRVNNRVDAFGEPPNPEKCEPPAVPPTIVAQFAAEVGEDRATLKAEISPHFWGDTSFYLEYGTEDCELGGCDRSPLGTNVDLPGATVDFALTTPGVALSGLEPGTTYHYRFVTESSGGGPVFGIGEGEEGATFSTRRAAVANTACPNQEFRVGQSAGLPDCRAYEMVSPIDKADGSVVGRPGGPVIDRSATDGGRFTFSSYRAFGDAEGSNFLTQYLAERDPGTGWQTNSISPPVGVPFVNIGVITGNEYRAFSDDLCTGWFVRHSDPPLDEAAPESFANIYSRNNCPASSPAYEALIDVPVSETNTKSFWPEPQGFSEDEGTAVFRANGKLTEDAAAGLLRAGVYVWVEGKLQPVSILPDGKATTHSSSVGSSQDSSSGRGLTGTVARAVSTDGSRIYWMDSVQSQSFIGTLYVRVDGAETRKVSSLASEKQARFWTASADGSLAFFTIDEDLYRYDFDTDSVTPIASKVGGVAGLSTDGSRLYFVSREALAPEAVEGAPNLYLEEGEEKKLVAVLDPDDADLDHLSLISPDPSERLSRLSEDGVHLAFVSISPELAESTAGYENTDLARGEPAAEVYLYDAGTEELNCISCDPSGARPSSRMIDTGSNDAADLYAAASIPPWTTQLYASRVLREDGSRLYFNSYTPLVAADANGKADVYQWEEPGTGDCTEASAAFVESAGGCIDLISSGKSAVDSEFLDASESGDDVFFATEQSLVKSDPEAIDVYDARVGGGLPDPPAPPAGCVGEGCQPPPGSSPALVDPVTQGVQGSGNVKPKKKPRRCPKGKHKVKRKGKVRCVKNRKGKRRAKHRITSHRRAAR